MKGNILIPVVVIVLLLGGLAYAGFMVYQKENEIKKMQKENDSLEASVKEIGNALKTEIKLKDNLKTEMDTRLKKAQTRVEEKNAENENLKKELETEKKQTVDLKKSKDALEKEKKTLQTALKKKEDEAAALTKKNNELKKSADQKDKLLSGAQAKIKAVITERDEAKKKADDTAQASVKLTKVSAARAAWRGTILLESGKHEEALKEFTAAVEGNPANKQAYKGLALCYEALGKKEDASAWWQNYIRTGPDNEDLKEARKHLDALKE